MTEPKNPVAAGFIPASVGDKPRPYGVSESLPVAAGFIPASSGYKPRPYGVSTCPLNE